MLCWDKNIIAGMIIMVVFGQSLGNQVYQKVGVFGDIVERDEANIKDGIVERVMIHAKKSAKSSNTIDRKGIIVRYKDAKATILICHGFMCDKFDVGFLRYLFPKGTYNFMTFDFRAHGENTNGQYCTFGRDEAQDVLSAARFLRNHPDLQDKPLFVYGFSMGAVASIEAQAQDAKLFDAMILDCPFESTEKVIKRGLKNLKLSLFGYEFDLPGRAILEKYAFHPYVQSFIKVLLKTVAHMDPKNIQTYIYPISPAESIKKVSIPCFFIHCKNDEKISVNSIRTIYNNAGGYKALWLTNGRRHFDSFFYNPEKYTRKIHKFLDLVVTGELYARMREKVTEDQGGNYEQKI